MIGVMVGMGLHILKLSSVMKLIISLLKALKILKNIVQRVIIYNLYANDSASIGIGAPTFTEENSFEISDANGTILSSVIKIISAVSANNALFDSTGSYKGGTDCDDTSVMIGSNANDSDCDGIITEFDCNDSDKTDSDFSGDCDNDGILTIDDCDDSDHLAPSYDADCDGIIDTDKICYDTNDCTNNECYFEFGTLVSMNSSDTNWYTQILLAMIPQDY